MPAADSLEALGALCRRRTDPADVPHAIDVVHAIPLYDGTAIEAIARDTSRRAALLEEWGRVLRDGAGVLAIRGALADTTMLDAVTGEFERIMEEEAGSVTDHFAPEGANTRVWNAHEKLGVRAPALFVRYNASAALALASRAWLGPGYQVTAQINVVPPGGAAQSPHRDYHLGFMDAELLADYPDHVHALSPCLTLQGAIAHSDMPLESGPTQLLPFSQLWPPGYAASAREEVRALFAERFVQLPLAKGDALFFNPALLHAAGDNRTGGLRRVANLLQISSPFGRAMEIVDRVRLCRAVYPALSRMLRGSERETIADADGIVSDAASTGEFVLDRVAREAVVAATAEGYPFPANLELVAPGGGLRPLSQQDLLDAALEAGHSAERFGQDLDAYVSRQRSH